MEQPRQAAPVVQVYRQRLPDHLSPALAAVAEVSQSQPEQVARVALAAAVLVPVTALEPLVVLIPAAVGAAAVKPLAVLAAPVLSL
jgi:hypothetical protein